MISFSENHCYSLHKICPPHLQYWKVSCTALKFYNCNLVEKKVKPSTLQHKEILWKALVGFPENWLIMTYCCVQAFWISDKYYLNWLWQSGKQLFWCHGCRSKPNFSYWDFFLLSLLVMFSLINPMKHITLETIRARRLCVPALTHFLSLTLGKIFNHYFLPSLIYKLGKLMYPDIKEKKFQDSGTI